MNKHLIICVMALMFCSTGCGHKDSKGGQILVTSEQAALPITVSTPEIIGDSYSGRQAHVLTLSMFNQRDDLGIFLRTDNQVTQVTMKITVPQDDGRSIPNVGVSATFEQDGNYNIRPNSVEINGQETSFTYTIRAIDGMSSLVDFTQQGYEFMYLYADTDLFENRMLFVEVTSITVNGTTYQTTFSRMIYAETYQSP